MKIFWLVILSALIFCPSNGLADDAVQGGRYYGTYLHCDDGFLRNGDECLKLPPATNGRYDGVNLICDNGYKNVDGQCVALPPVTNGRYYGTMLVCDSGFLRNGDECLKLPPATNGRYDGVNLICDNGYKNVNGQCVALPPVINGRYYGTMLVCDSGYVISNDRCEPSAQNEPFPPTVKYYSAPNSSAGSSYSSGAPSLSYPLSLPNLPPRASSGSNYDPLSGNSYRWRTNFSGETVVNGVNLYTGSMWKTTIEKDGSMRGYDKDMNPWNYNSQTGSYFNYGTGEMCIGTGALRSCF